MIKLLWIGILWATVPMSPARQPAGAADPARLLPKAAADDQGIEGIVYPVSGNRMPSPDRKTAPPRGIKSTVYVFERTNINQVTRQGQTSYYLVINTKLVKQADTDDSGYFKISLPPGTYSIFTRKGDLFYASRRDEKNNIAPVEVLPGKFTKVDCKIEGERKAVY
ncbi:MAG: carboxypeptidase regulatory-like domain-containing protein [Bacteroidota bacterium]